jgi:tripartite-type tricarboxylate transporter receptor subunit TctC
MRGLLVAAALAAVSVALSTTVTAQPYPTRPVRFLVPFPTGSLPDQLARMVAQELHESLGQPFIVENKPGAVGTVGTAEGARAAPDGYTIVMTTNSTLAAAGALYKKLQYDPVKDFMPVVLISRTSMILLVRPDFPARDLKGFIQYARSRKDGLTAGSGSAGSQVSIAKLKAGGGLNVVEVPYKGVPLAVTDVISGQVDFTFADFAVSLAQMKGGKLRGIGVTSAQRTPLAPDIAAIAEELPGYQTVLWYGVVAPAGTPRGAIDQIHDVVVAAMKKPVFQSRFDTFGVEPAPMNPDEFRDFIRLEIERWTRDIRQAGIQPE